MKRLAIRWAILLPLFALFYLCLPAIYKQFGISATKPVEPASRAVVVAPEIVPTPEPDVAVHAQQLNEGICRAAEHTAAPKTKQDIYKWVDADGRTHFGDSRQSNTAKRVDVKQQAAAQFSLNVHESGSPMPLDFRNQLEVRIRKSYTVLAQLLPIETIRASDVNLWVFASNTRYESFKQQHAPGLSGTSTGFHSSRKNIAAVWHRSDEQLMRTAIHEAAHVNNWAMLGRTPTWLNEGLAEYLERMKVYGQAVEIEPNKGWLRTLKKKPLGLPAVLRSSYQDWSGTDRSSLYAHSWAFVYFLLGEDDTRKLLKGYLAATAAQPCVTNDFIEHSDANFVGGFARLSSNFSVWLPDQATAHVY